MSYSFAMKINDFVWFYDKNQLISLSFAMQIPLKSKEIHGNQRKSMKINGNQKKSMEIN